jgi:hypothetical protein
MKEKVTAPTKDSFAKAVPLNFVLFIEISTCKLF